MRHQSESMRVGIIDKLRKGFEEGGKKGTNNLFTHLGDPTRAKEVSEYMAFKRREQGMCGVLPEQAKHISRVKMDKLMVNMYGKILGLKRGQKAEGNAEEGYVCVLLCSY